MGLILIMCYLGRVSSIQFDVYICFVCENKIKRTFFP